MFSLNPTVDDDGVTFRSTYDGSSHRLTPESAVAVQAAIGADIQMVLDVCPPLPSTPDGRSAPPSSAPRRGPSVPAARRGPTARRCSASCRVASTADLRVEAARRTVALDFDGYGIGGLSVGEPRPEMLARPRRHDAAVARRTGRGT